MTSLLGQTVLLLVFFGLSMVFSASETALVSLSRPRLKKLIAHRAELASAFAGWLAAPQYLLTTLLIGNTLSNVVAMVLTTSVTIACLPGLPHAWVETGAWLGMSFLLFVFGEFIPKSLARHYPERVSLFSLRGLDPLSRWITPVVRWSLTRFERLFPSLEGVPVSRLSVYSLEEIREMIQASAVQGDLPRRSSQMMERVLTLNRLTVARIMTPFEKVESVNLEQEPETVLDQVAEAGRTRVPAYHGNPRKIMGYLHVKDLLQVWRGALPLHLDTLLRKPLYIPSTFLASDLLEEFRKGASHLAVVVGTPGDCLGIVTLEDVLEEIVGEILDEYDVENPRGIH